MSRSAHAARGRGTVWLLALALVALAAPQCPPGAPQAPPPAEDPPRPNPWLCKIALDRAGRVCCGLPGEPGLIALPVIPTEDLVVPSCEAGEPPTVLSCVRADDAGPFLDEQQQGNEVEKEVEFDPSGSRLGDRYGPRDDPDLACANAILDAQLRCGLPDPGEFEELEIELPACEELAAAPVNLPRCEDLEAIRDELGCSLFEMQDGAPTYPEEIAQRAQEAVDDALFDVDPTQIPVDAFDPQPLNDGTPTPGDYFFAAGLVATDWNTPLGTQRLELPGSFVRKFVREALRAVLAAFEDGLTAFEPDGVACDPDSLLCTVNPLRLLRFPNLMDEVVRNEVQGVAVDFEISEEGNGGHEDGYVLSDLVVDVPIVIGQLDTKLQIRWNGEAAFEVPRLVRLDLGQDTHLQWIPLHQEDQDGDPQPLSPIDLDRSWLDRGLAVRMTNFECEAFRRKVVRIESVDLSLKDLLDLDDLDDEKRRSSFPVFDEPDQGEMPNLAGRYYTYFKPYDCVCGGSGAAQKESICVFDPWPFRDSPFGGPFGFDEESFPLLLVDGAPDAYEDLQSHLGQQGWTAHEVYCEPGANAVYEPDPSFPELSQRIPATAAVGPPYSDALLDGIVCQDREIPRVPTRTVQLFDGNVIVQKSVFASSAAGAALNTSIGVGSYRVALSNSTFVVDFDFVTQVVKRIEEKLAKVSWLPGFLKKIIKWIIRIVLEIVRFTVNAAVSTTLTLASPFFITNGVTVDFSAQDLLVHSVLTHTEPDPSQVSVGLRRVVTNKPTVDVDLFDFEFGAPECEVLGSSEANLFDRFKAFITCPISLAQNLTAFLSFPVKSFFFETVSDLVPKLNEAIGTRISAALLGALGQNNLARAANDAVAATAIEPYFLSQVPASVQGFFANPGPRQLPPGFVAVCAASGIPMQACLLLRNWAAVDAGADGGLGLHRMGAKTHYRSELAQGLVEADFDYPPLAYCVREGDPDDVGANYSFARDDLETQAPLGNGLLVPLTDLTEIDRTPIGDPVTDWTTECAAFTDVAPRFSTFVEVSLQGLGEIQVRVALVPTLRTQVLINETFFCPDDQSCDPGLMGLLPDGRPTLRQRAVLAVCSMAGDFWVQSCADSPCDDTDLTFDNALAVGSSSLAAAALTAAANGCGGACPNAAPAATAVAQVLAQCQAAMAPLAIPASQDLPASFVDLP